MNGVIGLIVLFLVLLTQEDEEIDGSILQMMFDDANGDDILSESLKTKK